MVNTMFGVAGGILLALGILRWWEAQRWRPPAGPRDWRATFLNLAAWHLGGILGLVPIAAWLVWLDGRGIAINGDAWMFLLALGYLAGFLLSRWRFRYRPTSRKPQV